MAATSALTASLGLIVGGGVGSIVGTVVGVTVGSRAGVAVATGSVVAVGTVVGITEVAVGSDPQAAARTTRRARQPPSGAILTRPAMESMALRFNYYLHLFNILFPP